jgi:GH15 family glucan-1,4-alpha-glucosidase
MRMQLVIRFDYGYVVPWVTRHDGRLRAVAGPDGLALATPVETHGEDLTTTAEFTVAEGERVPFVLTWFPSHQQPPGAVDAAEAIEATTSWWEKWSGQSSYDGKWTDAVQRSLVTLKSLTYGPTGGIVAAPTTSLPEQLGGPRNWDYRYSWLRDATFTLYALMLGGYRGEAVAWRDWLLRAAAGHAKELQIMYGIAGERRLTEVELGWLPGYEGSTPVRVGNAAYDQLQFDVYGEVMDAMHYARRAGIEPHGVAWDLQRNLIGHLETQWRHPDHGLWEVRGPPRHFTHSKIMTWVAFDRATRAVEEFQLEGPVDRWQGLCHEIHEEVLREGFDAERNTFTQSYGSSNVDASLLLIPQVGFLPASDPRFRGTVEAIERELVDGPFVHRYRTEQSDDGLPPGEGAFLLCSFWLIDALTQIGRVDEARRRFEQLLALRNDVGLLAEEYDASADRLIGNFPQAFSHIGLVNSACNLSAVVGPARDRSPADPRESTG